MLNSMEVRWFLAGTVPEKIEQWFHSGYVPARDATIGDETRDDTYLCLPDIKTLGIKLRAGKKIEVKQQQSTQGVLTIAAGVEGCIERWLKWSFDLKETDDKTDPIPSQHEQGFWVVVKKRRLLRKFEVDAEKKVTAVDALTRFPDEGCNMEIAWLEVNAHKWWTLGFESFGKLENVESNLRLTLEQVLADPDFPEMKAGQSYAYPAWLAMMMAENIEKTP